MVLSFVPLTFTDICCVKEQYSVSNGTSVLVEYIIYGIFCGLTVIFLPAVISAVFLYICHRVVAEKYHRVLEALCHKTAALKAFAACFSVNYLTGKLSVCVRERNLTCGVFVIGICYGYQVSCFILYIG